MGKRPGPWAVGVAVWVLVLAGGAVWASRTGAATSRDQLTIGQARPAVDRAVAQVVLSTVAGTAVADTIVTVSGFEKIEDCRVTPVRTGARYHRVVRIYTGKGTEAAVLRRIAVVLPAGYRVRVSSGDEATMSGDAGEFVSLIGSTTGPGQLRIAAETGCRPTGDVAEDPPPASPDPAGSASVSPGPVSPGPVSSGREPLAAAARLLATLGLRYGAAVRRGVPCPDGKRMETVELTAPRLRLDQAAVETVTGRLGTVVLADLDLIAYRDGATDVVLRIGSAETFVTATVRC